MRVQSRIGTRRVPSSVTSSTPTGDTRDGAATTTAAANAAGVFGVAVVRGTGACAATATTASIGAIAATGMIVFSPMRRISSTVDKLDARAVALMRSRIELTTLSHG